MKPPWRTFSAATAMTLAAVLAGCTPHDSAAASTHAATRERPASLDTSFKRTSAAGKYVVEITPPAPGVAVGRIQGWTITLQGATGEPVPGASIDVSGDMPEHGHGLPTQPQVKPGTQPGHYALEGMKFNMGGWWVLHLKIRGPQGADEVTFNIVLPE
ncbi:FixH family protein [Variovorax sp. J22R133]|uniref:FixH family protein n=1 Tax=Variovorax brevis TaxID=3053503 RepID=UPI002575E472|nr:FixH family protein [Variovorax sp. J22R133]MDM0116502.1 FixH family protein [Variovorax sp. J22R133]